MNKILVVTTEPLPLPGGLTTGAGLRAWGLAEGLRSAGFHVIIASPLEGDQAKQQAAAETPDPSVRFFSRSDLGALVENENPDVVVMQHWGLVYALPDLKCPLVIDLAGPHLLERQYWGNQDLHRDLQEKLSALRRADFITLGGVFQRHYFYPYLAMAGFDITNTNFPVIPFSVAPQAVEGSPAPGSEATFIYGGAFLAWQNPEKPIRWLLDEVDKAGRGRLLFYGGAHPSMDASGGRFLSLYQFVKAHPRVEVRGWKPFDQLTKEYAAEGHVALDLMERNPERELAYTTRTMVYLQCGLPVVYNNYSEISLLVQRNGCGWCLDPEDEAGFRTLVQKIIGAPDEVLKLRESARNAAINQNWNQTIAPLAEFCQNPQFREKTNSQAFQVPESESHAAPAIKPDLNVSSSTITSIRRNFFARPGRWMGIIVYLPVWVVSKYLCYRLKVTSSSRAQ